MAAPKNFVRFGGVNKASLPQPKARLHDLDFDADKGIDHAVALGKLYKSNVKAVFKKAMSAADAGDDDEAAAEAEKVMALCERLAEQAEGMNTLIRELDGVPRGLRELPTGDVLALLDMDDIADICEMLEGVIQQFLF